MAEAILELEEVTKRFDHTVAADGVSLAVYRGEFFTFPPPSDPYHALIAEGSGLPRERRITS